MLTFDDKKHEYRWNDRIIPSVTTIIGEYLKIKISGERYYVHVATAVVIMSYIFERAQFVGTEFHKAVKFYLSPMGLDFNSLIISFMGYEEIDLRPMMQQFKQWEAKYKPKYILIEKPLYSKKHAFAGTPDIYADIKIGKKTVRVLIDIKTGLFEMVAAQLAAYEVLIREETKYRGRIKHYVLHIPKNGSDYKFIEIKDIHAWNEFKSLHFNYKYRRAA